MIRVLVAGAGGRMGTEVVKAVTAAPDMEVVAAVDPGVAGCVIPGTDAPRISCVGDLASAIRDTDPDVMVDFTRPDVVVDNLRVALAAGVDCVVGTTGVSEDVLSEVAQSAPEGTCLFFAPNFAIGAVLMMQFAERAARFMEHCEIIELHHDKKLDAPSGTAMRTARIVAAARPNVPAVPGRESEIAAGQGARGAEIDGVHVHSVRLPGLMAHQEVVFGGTGQTLSIRHDSIDRTCFMPGVVLACREVGSRSGLVVGLEELMGE